MARASCAEGTTPQRRLGRQAHVGPRRGPRRRARELPGLADADLDERPARAAGRSRAGVRHPRATRSRRPCRCGARSRPRAGAPGDGAERRRRGLRLRRRSTTSCAQLESTTSGLARLVRRARPAQPIDVTYDELDADRRATRSTRCCARSGCPTRRGGPAGSHAPARRRVGGLDRALPSRARGGRMSATARRVSQLRALEAEAVYVMREVVAELLERRCCCSAAARTRSCCCAWPRRRSGPRRFPFPVLHVDTGHNFPEVIEFRDRRLARGRPPADRRLGAGLDRRRPRQGGRGRGRRATGCRR